MIVVLRQVQAFLPRMAKADTKLKERMEESSPNALNIENIDDQEGPLIEMVRLVSYYSSCTNIRQ